MVWFKPALSSSSPSFHRLQQSRSFLYYPVINTSLISQWYSHSSASWHHAMSPEDLFYFGILSWKGSGFSICVNWTISLLKRHTDDYIHLRPISVLCNKQQGSHGSIWNQRSRKLEEPWWSTLHCLSWAVRCATLLLPGSPDSRQRKHKLL